MPKSSILTIKTLCLTCVFYNSNAFAQELLNKDVTPIVKIEVKGKTAQERTWDEATSKVVVTNGELFKFGDTNVYTALAKVQGVSLVDGKLQLPGMGSTRTQILVDGQEPKGITPSNLSSDMVERVEIYRAPSAEFSTQGIAGTINIILKKIPQAPQQQLRFTQSQEFRPSSNINWSYSNRDGKFSYVLSSSASISNSSRPSVTESIVTRDKDNQILTITEKLSTDRTKNENLFFRGEFNWQFENENSLSIAPYIAKNRASLPRGEAYNYILGASEDFKFLNKDTSASGLDYGAKIRGKLNVADAQVSYNFGINIGDRNTRSSLIADQAFSQNQSENTQLQGFTSDGKVRFGKSGEHEIVSGWDYSISDTKVQFIRNEVSSNDSPLVFDSKFQTKVPKFAAFVQDEWKFSKGSNLYFGLRWESIESKILTPDLKTFRNKTGVWSPIVQALWKLNTENNDRLRLGLSRTFQAPQSYMLVRPFIPNPNNSVYNTSTVGNVNLLPETAWSIDGAFEHNDKEDFSYSIRSYYRKIENYLMSDVDLIDGLWVSRSVNKGNATSKGLEFGSQFPIKKFYSNAPAVTLRVYLTRNWSDVEQIKKPNNVLTPLTTTISFGLDYVSKELPISTGFNIKYFNGNWQKVNSISNSYTPVNVTLDSYLNWKINDRAKLRLSLATTLKKNRIFAASHDYQTFNVMLLRPERSLLRASAGIELGF